MTTPQIERFREMLLTERERVRAAIDHLRIENPGSLEDETGELVSSSHDNHLADMATATFDREVAETLENNEVTVLTAIEAALRRIDEGTYGTCQSCGRPISPERLEAIPYATRCIECKRTEERG